MKKLFSIILAIVIVVFVLSIYFSKVEDSLTGIESISEIGP